MARLYVTEYEHMIELAGGRLPVGKEPAVASQAFTFTGTAAASAAFQSRTKFIRVHTDAICSIVFGTAPVATGDSMRLAAGQTEYFGIPGEASYKVSAITNT